MEKIREALAKARMDKAFRDQHPVSEVEDLHPSGQTDGFSGGAASDRPERGIPEPTNDRQQTSSDMALPPGGGATDTGHSDEHAEVLEPMAGQRTSVIPRWNKPAGVTPITVEDDEGSYPQTTEDGDWTSEADAVTNDPLGTDFGDSAHEPEEPEQRESQVAVEFADVPAPVRGKGDKRRSVFRLLGMSFLGLLAVVWSIHTFVYPLDEYTEIAAGFVDPLFNGLSDALGALSDSVAASIGEVWFALVEKLRDLLS